MRNPSAGLADTTFGLECSEKLMAKERAAAESAELLAPLMPNGLDARELLAGRASLDQLAPPDGPRLPRIVREQLQR